MRLIILILLILFAITLNAQNFKLIYQLDYKRDSLAKSFNSQNTILETDGEMTKFFYEKLIRIDSLSKNGMSLNVSFPLSQAVKRKTGDSENENFISLNGNYYQYKSNDKLDWKVSNVTKKVEDCQLQMANATFGGRKWIAWFCKEIPLAEGPYIFNGLPGLIYELRDSKDNFIYSLVSIEKVKKLYDTHNILETHFGIKPLRITENRYKKLQIDDYNNPFAQFNNMSDGSWGYQYGDKYISTQKELLEIKRQYQEEIRNNNNPIKLNKAIKYSK